ncbi:MAG: caspase family protein, partial [Ferruginibacter sp.]|nr:caspase family protein [Ferruginibacter sp.]
MVLICEGLSVFLLKDQRMSFSRNFFFLLLTVSSMVEAQQPRLVLPIGHTKNINEACFSPDGNKIVTASPDMTAKIWDVTTGLLLADLEGHTEDVNSALFSPDGKKIVTASADKTAKIWDATTGLLLANLTEHAGAVNSAFFSPDGKKIVTASADRTAKIWNTETGKVLMELKAHDYNINFAQFSPDGSKVVTASDDNTAKIWNVFSGELLLTLKKHSSSVDSAQFNFAGTRIVTISGDKTVKVWDVATGRLLMDIKRHTNYMQSVQFSPDGNKLLTASLDHTVKLWNITSGDLVSNIDLKTSNIGCARFSPDGLFYLTSDNGYQGGVKIWDAITGKLFSEIKFPVSILSAQFSPDGKKILSVLDNKTATINETSSGAMLSILKGQTSEVRTARFKPDLTKIVTASADGYARIWDAGTGQLSLILKGYTSWVGSAEYSADGKNILIVAGDATTKIWDAETGNLVNGLKKLKYCRTAQLSQDQKNIVTTEFDEIVKIWDVGSESILVDLKGHKKAVNMASFSTDGKKVVSASSDATAKIWDVSNGQLLLDLKGHVNAVRAACFSPDDKKVLTASDDGTAKIWDAVTGQLLLTLFQHTTRLMSASFSPDGKKIIVITDDRRVKVLDASSGVMLADLWAHSNNINTAFFSSDGRKIITASSDNTIIIWDGITGKFIYTFFAVGVADYFSQISNGYYQTTPAAAKLLHYVTKDLKVITFEQLDVKYNRPDKVLEGIGSSDTALIRSYRKAYEKRIKKLGIDTTAFRDGYSVPEADFANRDNIEFEQKNDKLKLDFKSVDSAYKLDRFNVWVNETPLYGQRGISLRGKNRNNFDSTITIDLSQGENRIETSITNVNGTESYRMPLQVNYTPANKQQEKTYFIGIGIDQFAESKYNLKYSTKDIRDLCKKLKEKYTDILIDTLFNQNVTISNVKALKQKLQQTSVNDKVIISYSGHGMLSKEFDYYLSTYAVNFDNPKENGLPYDELENLLDSIPARKKLMLIDACHSGEVDK